jgi:hypothetical protein
MLTLIFRDNNPNWILLLQFSVKFSIYFTVNNFTPNVVQIF